MNYARTMFTPIMFSRGRHRSEASRQSRWPTALERRKVGREVLYTATSWKQSPKLRLRQNLDKLLLIVRIAFLLIVIIAILLIVIIAILSIYLYIYIYVYKTLWVAAVHGIGLPRRPSDCDSRAGGR